MRVRRIASTLVLLSLAGLACARHRAPLASTLPDAPPMPAPERSGTITVNDAALYYAMFHVGGPAPVVLLHGGMGDGDLWAAEVPRLARNHEVIVLDTRGHGRSTRSAAPFSYALFASDVLGVLDSLRRPRVAIVGWSDGGVTGLVMAIHHPERVERLFTYGANFDRTAYLEGPRDSVQAARFRARREAEYRRLSPTPDGFAALGRALGALYAVEPALTAAELGTIRVPTMIAAGEAEQFIARAHTEALARAIPGARLSILPRLNHGGPLQDPAAFHRALADFLDRDLSRER